MPLPHTPILLGSGLACPPPPSWREIFTQRKLPNRSDVKLTLTSIQALEAREILFCFPFTVVGREQIGQAKKEPRPPEGLWAETSCLALGASLHAIHT